LFVYDQAGHLLGEYTTSGTRIAEYVWMDDTLVGIIKTAEGSTYQFVETDALGTPRAVVNPTNNTIIWRWDITPTAFGEHNPVNDPDGNGNNYSLGLRYPGQFNDGLDFINYNGFRDYYANSGRYLESDPIGLEGGISTYGYVGAQPLTLSDPLGLAPRLFNLPLRDRKGRALSAADKALFINAVNVARKKLKDCKCSCPSPETGHCFREDDKIAVMKMLEETDFYYDGNFYEKNTLAGLRYEPYGAILYPGAFTSGLDFLASTLAHEANHRTDGYFTGEPGSFHIDKTCFGIDHYGAPEKP